MNEIDGNKILEMAKKLAQQEAECACPTLFRFAIERGISLVDLRNEIRWLISMSDQDLERFK